MKVAVSSSGKDLNSQIDPRFGRCAYFLILETDDMSYEAFDNENIALGGGAGIQSAQFIASKGAKAVITGNCGPNAVRTLSAAGVELYVGENGTVKDAAQRYKNGELRSTADPNVSDHYGMGETGPTMGNQGQTSGQSMVMGRGMCCCRHSGLARAERGRLARQVGRRVKCSHRVHRGASDRKRIGRPRARVHRRRDD